MVCYLVAAAPQIVLLSTKMPGYAAQTQKKEKVQNFERLNKQLIRNNNQHKIHFHVYETITNTRHTFMITASKPAQETRSV